MYEFLKNSLIMILILLRFKKDKSAFLYLNILASDSSTKTFSYEIESFSPPI